ncbi:SusD/RagB family nutrient-binding outer membrane lipoprotein [Algivirga pacifica]|uniref:SusD/RagB family nutrient-binding outer membrane lipoprotein n=1 Tax=Algivirga pacifica TaxID=1162670 RepID=A0ABP9CYD2_9BACT
MRFLKYSIRTAALAAAVSISSCDHFEELNVNPNKASEVSTAGLLAQSQANIVYNVFGELGQLGAQYTQQLSQIEYPEKSHYDDAGSSGYSSIYTGGLADAQEIINIVDAERTMDAARKYGDIENQKAVAMILKAWAFHNATDVWGDLPYSEALKGDEGILLPKFDTQEEIYAGLQADLDEAIALINETPNVAIPADYDLIMGGDMTMWKKFAKSLKLRIAMRLSDVDEAAAKAVINDAAFSGVLEAGDVISFEHLSTNNEANPLYIDNVVNTGADNFAISDVIVDKMLMMNDPRLAVYAAPTVNDASVYAGFPYGKDRTFITGLSSDDYSMVSEAFGGQTAPSIIMTGAEVLFIKAEAAQRGYISGSAAAYYEEAVSASLSENGVDKADADAYLATVPYDASDWKMVLGTQKWLALFNQGIQAWSEFRRLDAPMLSPAEASSISQIPTRRAYSSGPYSSNAENVEAAAARLQGGDDFTSRVWWDVKLP